MARPSLNSNAHFAYRYLLDKYQLQPHQAAGIVGNLMQESTMSTAARNSGDGRDGSDSIGVGQWNGSRAQALQRFAGDKVGDLPTQLDFVIHEMKNGPERSAYEKLMGAKDVKDAAAAMISYERPSGWSANNPTAGHGWDNRLAWAQEIMGVSPDVIARAEASSGALAANDPASANVDVTPAPDEKKGLFGLTLPDTIAGVSTGDIKSGLGGLAQLFSTQSENMNEAVPQGGRAGGSEPIQLSLGRTQTPGLLGGGSAGPSMAGLSEDELLKLLMQQGGLGGLGGMGRFI